MTSKETSIRYEKYILKTEFSLYNFFLKIFMVALQYYLNFFIQVKTGFFALSLILC